MKRHMREKHCKDGEETYDVQKVEGSVNVALYMCDVCNIEVVRKNVQRHEKGESHQITA